MLRLLQTTASRRYELPLDFAVSRTTGRADE
jgi:hypothetical protein